MFWLGLISSIAFVPGYTGATLPTGWAVLSCLLPLTLWSKAEVGPLHWVLFAFLSYAAASLLWTTNVLNGIEALWMLSIVALAFRLGSTDLSLPALWKGLAYGLGVSSVVCIFQWFYFEPVLHLNWNPPGLMYNSANLGAICGLVVVALATEKLWWHMALVAPALVLSHSRAGLAIAAIGLLACWVRRPVVIACVALAGFAAITFHPSSSDIERFNIWFATWDLLTPFGHGAASYLGLWIATSAGIMIPEYAHNEWLQFAFEYGAAAAIPIGVMGFTLTQGEHKLFPCAIAFFALACISYPLHSPLTALVGAVAAGRVVSDWDSLWLLRGIRRLPFLSWVPSPRADASSFGRAYLPIQPSTS
jgi:hypothetical protein